MVRAGVSKVLSNNVEPAAHPPKKMTHMLSEKQASAYLAAPASAGGPEVITSAIELQRHSSSHSDVEEPPVEPLQPQDLTPAPLPVRPAGTVVSAGLLSSSGSVSDPGLIQSMSVSGGSGTARVSGGLEYSSTNDDLACQQVRYAISQPGTPPAAHSSSATQGTLDAAAVHKQQVQAPSAVAVIGPLDKPGMEVAVQQKQPAVMHV